MTTEKNVTGSQRIYAAPHCTEKGDISKLTQVTKTFGA